MLRDQLEALRARLAEAGWAPWLILGLAVFLRFFLLGIKPPHFDEGINGWFVDQMVKNGFYRYDPTNYHGPLHFYILFLSQTLLGRNIWALRLPVVLVSIICVWLTLKFEPFVGRSVTRIAALAMAVSPGFVFYGRYSIHEVWLVLFSMLFILGLLGLWKFGTPNYLWCAGMGVAGMILTKETYIIHLGCAALAIPVLMVSNALNRLPDAKPARQTWTYVDLAMVIGTGIAVIVFFYSGTFFHWSGMKDLYRAYSAWFTTGSEGHGHEKPWYYWVVTLMVRYELPGLAGLVLCLFCQRFKNVSLRYLAIYGVGTLIAYSIVQYKTPWCIISIIWPFLFIFGAALVVSPVKLDMKAYGALILLLVALLGWATWARLFYNFTDWWPFYVIPGVGLFLVALADRAATYAVSAVLLVASLGSTIWLNYFRCTTDTEPYVYVQTYNDIFKFTEPLLKLARRDPSNYHLAGSIIRASSYPLPWILGDFSHVGYYEHDALPEKADADFLLVQEDRIAEIEGKLQDSYFTETVRLRAFQDSSKAYFRANVFKDLFPKRTPEFKGKKSG